MSPLRSALASYLALRRALGFKLKYAEKLLGQFIAYLEDLGEEAISVEHALAWALLPEGVERSYWGGYRLSVVRCFARYLQTIDPATEVPATDVLPQRKCRATPYLYSEEQIAALIGAAGKLGPSHRAATYTTLIGLLAITGMRVGEAMGLDRDDVDFQAGLIVICDTKFGKSRELALHASTVEALRWYLDRADRPPSADTEAVLVSTSGARLRYSTVQWTFAKLTGGAGIKPRSARCRPRLHDLRHTFAVRTLLDAYRDGGEVEGRLAALSTYLGHTDPASTYWYLSASPELMGLAAERLERHLGDRP
jgi:integrase